MGLASDQNKWHLLILGLYDGFYSIINIFAFSNLMNMLVRSDVLGFHMILHDMNRRYLTQQRFHLIRDLVTSSMPTQVVWTMFQLCFAILCVHAGTGPTVWQLTSQHT